MRSFPSSHQINQLTIVVTRTWTLRRVLINLLYINRMSNKEILLNFCKKTLFQPITLITWKKSQVNIHHFGKQWTSNAPISKPGCKKMKHRNNKKITSFAKLWIVSPFSDLSFKSQYLNLKILLSHNISLMPWPSLLHKQI